MLGSVAEAEDVVQETYLRWAEADHESLEKPAAWLTTTCSRLAIDVLRSARVRREEYVGPWLPEPWVGEGDWPADQLELDDSVSMALLLVLESLGAAERAAFLLHDVFAMPFDDVAAVLDKSPAACRQLASRARARLQAPSAKHTVDAHQHRQLTDTFFAAARTGDREALVALLHDDAALTTDGGGKASAARKVVHGSAAIVKFLVAVLGGVGTQERRLSTRAVWFNGAPGLLVYDDQQLVTAYTLEVVGSRVRSVFAVRNPDKLQAFVGTLDAGQADTLSA